MYLDTWNSLQSLSLEPLQSLQCELHALFFPRSVPTLPAVSLLTLSHSSSALQTANRANSYCPSSVTAASLLPSLLFRRHALPTAAFYCVERHTPCANVSPRMSHGEVGTMLTLTSSRYCHGRNLVLCRAS